MKWEILDNLPITNSKSLMTVLLKNRGLVTKSEMDEFLDPRNPEEIEIKELGISSVLLQKVLKRLEKAKKEKQKIIIFGDYDADGICSTAILWEALYKLGFDVMPYIPDRFKDGYGIKVKSFNYPQLKIENCKLIITIDNGIVAYDAVKEAKKRKIDVIVIDHHTKSTKKLSTDYILHSPAVCGSALAWFLSKELGIKDGLDLVALGTVADQMSLLGINRSLVKYGLNALNKTKRIGLRTLLDSLKINNVGVYEVGYLIAPRINAMGRLASAIDSLRFLCTRDSHKANDLNKLLNKTNTERQKIVDEVLSKSIEKVNEDKVIVISGDYHEGVIGLASGKITEKFYRPSIVLSENKNISKASARSVFGFNIIEAIKETGLIIEGGGHPMAAGFSIETIKIEQFRLKINEIAKRILTSELLERKLKIDMKIDFKKINPELLGLIKKLEPTGQNNYLPVFMSENVKVKEIKTVGNEGKHLKLKLSQNGIILDAIWFGFTKSQKLKVDDQINIAYSIEENTWNNKTSLQLKVKDIKVI